MGRNDVHRPAELVTENYSHVITFDNNPGGDDWTPSEHAHRVKEIALKAIEAEPRAATWQRGIWQCHHCGAHIRYGAVLRHVNGEAIAVGETCLENRFERATGEFHALRKQAQLDREKQRIVNARREWREEYPQAAWLDDETAVEAVGNGYIWDLHRKLRLYGSLSVRQVDAAARVVEREKQRAAERAVDDARTWIAARQGRVEVEGTVLARKVRDTDWGVTVKLLLRVDEESGSWKLWVTEPRALGDPAERGDKVRLRAGVERSDDDESFAFGSRPHLLGIDRVDEREDDA